MARLVFHSDFHSVLSDISKLAVMHVFLFERARGCRTYEPLRKREGVQRGCLSELHEP